MRVVFLLEARGDVLVGAYDIQTIKSPPHLARLVGSTIQDEAVNIAQSTPDMLHYYADVLACSFKRLLKQVQTA